MNIMRLAGSCLALTILACNPSSAQEHRHPPAAVPPTASAPAAAPYAGMERRQVKALSDQQIADLEAGRGMGLALAAELNGYPGPLHVLEHADALGLTSDQQTRTRALFDAMKAETIPLGRRLIAEETA